MTPRLEQWERGWRVYGPKCLWHSKDLPFASPDEALHVLALHEVVCKGSGVQADYKRPSPIALPPAPPESPAP